MTSTAPRRPAARRPVSRATYWRRRLFVGGLVLAVGLIAVNAVRGDTEPSADVQATIASAEGSDDEGAATTGPALGPTADKGRTGKKGKRAKKGAAATPVPAPTVVLPTAPVLAEPDGTCLDEDVSVTPSVEGAVAGQPATIVLNLRTLSAEACTWEVSADTVAVRISVGDDEVWASRHCTGRLRERTVVVREAVSTTYRLTWSTRRSDVGCPALTEYAEPGDYRVTAAAYGGEPADVVFELAAPVAPEPAPETKPETKPKPGTKPRPERQRSTDGGGGQT